MEPIWAIVPVVCGPELTEAAVSDLLAQSVPVRILIINQGVDSGFRDRLERLAEQHPELYLWSHNPPLPSLSASWNAALDMAWASGATEALVVNNDCRLDPRTVSILQAVLTWPKRGNLFVSAVGVTQEQFDARPDPLFSLPDEDPVTDATYDALPKGGPDFSCFMVSAAGHAKYRFDEGFVPAHCEDLDMHRRYLLGGDGDKIFSINLPYLHYGAQTIQQSSPEVRARIEQQTQAIARVHYAKKWGGPVNEETYLIPFNSASAQMDGRARTPYLQAHPTESIWLHKPDAAASAESL